MCSYIKKKNCEVENKNLYNRIISALVRIAPDWNLPEATGVKRTLIHGFGSISPEIQAVGLGLSDGLDVSRGP